MGSDQIFLSDQATLMFISPKFYNYDLLYLHKCTDQNKTYQVHIYWFWWLVHIYWFHRMCGSKKPKKQKHWYNR